MGCSGFAFRLETECVSHFSNEGVRGPTMSVNRKQVELLLERLQAAVRHPECLTCDCFVGFVTQLQLDCDQDIADLVRGLDVPKDQLHPCLGCDPCPPAELYAGYLSSVCCPETCCRLPSDAVSIHPPPASAS